MTILSRLPLSERSIKTVRILIILTVFCMIRLNGKAAEPGNDERPNIVLILADDMGFSDIGCYGGEINTPNLDRLADEGMRFTQFYNTSKSAPTRASLLTGLYHQQSDLLRDTTNNLTLAEALKKAGYSTMMSGKWHLGHWQDEQGTPVDRGFDRFFGFLGGAINFFTGEDFGTGENYMRLGRKPYDVPDDFYSTDAFTDYTLQFLNNRQKDKPFFLYLAHNAPHFPLQVPQEEIEKYKGKYSMGWDKLRERRYERMKNLGLIKPEWELSERDPIVPSWKSLSREEKEEEQLLMATYAAMIDRLDQQIGRLMDYLERKGLAGNTIVMFFSDNGGCPYDFNRTPDLPPGPAESYRTYDSEWANASNTPFRLYKQWVHEGGISTPMIVRWPGVVEPGSLTRKPAQLIDIMPTLLEAAEASYPDTYQGNNILPMEGKSLMPLFKGNEYIPRQPMFREFRGSRAVRKEQWKLVAERGKPWELYNIEADRSETNNLISEHPDLAEELESLYNRWAERTGARTNQEALEMGPNQQDRYFDYERERQ
ncbi:MAG: arylsulfatase [Bacteroidales bacterium]|nr:arylsulfatase [Bacteroidales bacterium]